MKMTIAMASLFFLIAVSINIGEGVPIEPIDASNENENNDTAPRDGHYTMTCTLMKDTTTPATHRCYPDRNDLNAKEKVDFHLFFKLTVLLLTMILFFQVMNIIVGQFATNQQIRFVPVAASNLLEQLDFQLLRPMFEKRDD